VVVGVDGSASSRVALHWGLRQAQLSGSPVRAVIAWRWPVDYGSIPPAIEVELRSDSAEMLSAMVDQALEKLPDAGCEQVVRRGRPAEVLLDESARAALLVVGSRGRGAFAGMLLGSVSSHCITHAGCPVVVVGDVGMNSDEEDSCAPQTS
jgi:nucleotide-binding universal stress UspA family protein